MYKHNVLLGSLLLILAELLLVMMAATIKFTANYLPVASIVFLRNLCVVLLLMPWLLHKGLLGQIRTRRWRLHLLRGTFGVSAMFCFFYAVAHLPLAEANLIKNAAPFFIPFIGFLWLGERITRQIIIATGLGLLGTFIVFKPELNDTVSHAALLGLLGGLFAGIAKVSIRKMSDTEPAVRILFYFSLIGTVISSIPMLWLWVTPTGLGWGLILALSLLALLGQLYLTQALSYAPAAQIAPLGYVSVIFAMSLGWLFWEDTLDMAFFIGAGLIVLASLSLAYKRETRRL